MSSKCVETAIHIVAWQSGVSGPENVTAFMGDSYKSGYDQTRKKYFVSIGISTNANPVQNPLLHEAGHIVRLYVADKEEITRQLDITSSHVDETVRAKGVLGEEFIQLWSMLLSKCICDELIGCYFGMNMKNKAAVKEAQQGRSRQTLQLFRSFLEEWSNELNSLVVREDGVNNGTKCLEVAKFSGRRIGGILGQFLAVEKADPKHVIHLDSMKMFCAFQKLAEQNFFPDSLDTFFQEIGLFPPFQETQN